MSGGRYSESKERVYRSSKLESSDSATREKEQAEYKSRIASARAEAPHKKAERTYNPQEDYDLAKVRLKITEPPKSAEELNICAIDNSGSNEKIAQKFRDSSPYIMSVLEAINPKAAICFTYFSDHCDRNLLHQEVDYVQPNQLGSQILASSAGAIKAAGGGDEPEAYECELKMVTTQIPFGNAKYKNLFLIGDQVAHGMDQSANDSGCPLDIDWQDHARAAYKVYDTFQVIGCGADSRIMALQQRFLRPERVPWDHVDLSSIEENKHRLMITPNVLLFLIARNYDRAHNLGLKKTKTFLHMLYENWLSNPIFGADTDRKAKEMIMRFAKYLEHPQAEINAMLKDIFVE